MPFGCTPSLIGTPPFTFRLTSAEIGTPKSGFGSPIFELLFPIFPFKNRKCGIGGKTPDIFAQHFTFEVQKGVLPMGGGVLQNPPCQVLNAKFRDRKPKFWMRSPSIRTFWQQLPHRNCSVACLEGKIHPRKELFRDQKPEFGNSKPAGGHLDLKRKGAACENTNCTH